MYHITRPADRTKRESAIVNMASIRRSCHLFPQFPKEKIAKTDAKGWTSDNVLELCEVFHINNYVDMPAFQSIY